VDRNTIVSMAPITELAIADPPIFEELASDFKEKLLDFAKRCSVALSDPDVLKRIEQYKKDFLMLPLKKRQ
ncbi:CC106 protein, partial [Atractosteus spatula]|nr:CC106 protein [Atractosteus spatula]